MNTDIAYPIFGDISAAGSVPDLHSVASDIAMASGPSATTQIVATAIENDTGTGAVVNPVANPSTDVHTAGEDSVIAATSLANAGTWEAAAQQTAGDTQATLDTLAKSAASGGQNQPLGSQLSLQDVTTTSSSAGATNNNGILLAGIAVVAAIAGYIYWKHKHKAPAE